jgi:hypothetical protein
MPFINGKYSMNPAYGRAMERNRSRGMIVNFVQSRSGSESQRQEIESDSHWVTINGRHVLIDDSAAEGRTAEATRRDIADTARRYGGSTA